MKRGMVIALAIVSLFLSFCSRYLRSRTYQIKGLLF